MDSFESLVDNPAELIQAPETGDMLLGGLTAAPRVNLGPTFDEARDDLNATLLPSLQPPTDHKLPVYLRLRPPTGDAQSLEVVNSTTVRTTTQQAVKEFSFTHVFPPETTQLDLYSQTLAPMVHNLSEKSGLLFCYGITNAGKTHTVLGPLPQMDAAHPSPSWGLVPRALADVLSLASTNNLPVSISYMEIYNEQIFDLLATSRQSLKLREANGQAFVRGLSTHPVSDLRQGLQLVVQASRQRVTATNNVNQGSSRSHCICQLGLADHKLWIVDLAGLERSKRTGGLRQTEANKINQSLMTLMRCLHNLRHQQRVPYRESKLTHLLLSHWTGPHADQTAMIANINPSDDSQHVLQYAAASKATTFVPQLAPAAAVDAYDANGHRRRKRDEEPNDGATKKPRQGMVSKIMAKLSPKRKTDKSTSQLQAQLSLAYAEIELLKANNEELQQQLEDMEENIRAQVVDELQAQWQMPTADKDEQIRELQRELNELRAQQLEDDDASTATVSQPSSEPPTIDNDSMEQESSQDAAVFDEAEDPSPTGKDTTEDDESVDATVAPPTDQKCPSLLGSTEDVVDVEEPDTVEEVPSEQADIEEDGDADRKPFADLSNTVPRGSLESESDESFGPNSWLFPKKKPRKDPSTGTFLKPRGRRPKGVDDWDENVGAWRLSVMPE